eukprot:m.1678449 g.1678449  ORF g.1678449 m.1678449 type:complete len:64 (-) comp204669_c0_seq1:33-224(-)
MPSARRHCGCCLFNVIVLVQACNVLTYFLILGDEGNSDHNHCHFINKGCVRLLYPNDGGSSGR